MSERRPMWIVQVKGNWRGRDGSRPRSTEASGRRLMSERKPMVVVQVSGLWRGCGGGWRPAQESLKESTSCSLAAAEDLVDALILEGKARRVGDAFRINPVEESPDTALKS